MRCNDPNLLCKYLCLTKYLTLYIMVTDRKESNNVICNTYVIFNHTYYTSTYTMVQVHYIYTLDRRDALKFKVCTYTQNLDKIQQVLLLAKKT